ncbi:MULTISPECIES: hypothetical protein [Sorangium]|uniref:hypothetical protein n=1 Tax=Sorangium TaxID=39643 RepID=UPI00101AAB55|nr:MULTISPECIES: hypothetical protein [Sorangium]
MLKVHLAFHRPPAEAGRSRLRAAAAGCPSRERASSGDAVGDRDGTDRGLLWAIVASNEP